MAKASERTIQEIQQLISGFEQSGMSRRQYCQQQQIGVPTLDYYRRRYAKKKPDSGQLIEVELRDPASIETQKASAWYWPEDDALKPAGTIPNNIWRD